MAIRARLLTDTELSLRFGPWISPQAELPYPLYVPARRDATAPSHRQRAASGIPQQPLPAVASELAIVRRSDREPNWEPYATTIRARIRIDPDTARAWSAPPDHSSDDVTTGANYRSEGWGSDSAVVWKFV